MNDEPDFNELDVPGLSSKPTDARVVRQVIYDHGGSRIWLEPARGGSRDLLADTYRDAELAVRVKACIEQYLGNKTETVMMPRSLTAENGAKAAMMGEFSINFPRYCRCEGEDDSCEVCDGSGEYMQSINVPWVTIKEIYSAAVKHFGQGV